MFTIVGWMSSEKLDLESFSFLFLPLEKNGELKLLNEKKASEDWVSQISELSRGKRRWRLILIDGTNIYENQNPYQAKTEICWAPVARQLAEREKNIYRENDSWWKAPDNIYLFAFRKRNCLSGQIALCDAKNAFDDCFPENCRFLVYNMPEKPECPIEQEIFRGLCIAATISCNEFPHYLLEGYQLYSAEIGIDTKLYDEYTAYFAEYCRAIRNRINDQFYYLERQHKERIIETSLDFRIDPLENSMEWEALGRDKYEYGQYGGIWDDDLLKWNREKAKNDQLIKNRKGFPRKYLNEQIVKVKRKIAESEIEGRFCSEEDRKRYEEELKELEIKLCMLGDREALNFEEFEGKKKEKEEAVTNILSGRKGHGGDVYKALVFSVAPFLVLLLCAVPGVYKCMKGELYNMLPFFAFLAVTCLINAALTMVYIMITKREIFALLRDYYETLSEVKEKIDNECRRYEAYLNDWKRYYTITKILNRHKDSVEEEKEMKILLKRHDMAVDHMEYTAAALIRSMGTEKNVGPDWFIDINIDFRKDPANNEAYEIIRSSQGVLEVKNSGIWLKAPFDFVKEVEFRREVLYG